MQIQTQSKNYRSYAINHVTGSVQCNEICTKCEIAVQFIHMSKQAVFIGVSVMYIQNYNSINRYLCVFECAKKKRRRRKRKYIKKQKKQKPKQNKKQKRYIWIESTLKKKEKEKKINHKIMHYHWKWKTRLGVPSIAGRILKVIETWFELTDPYSIALHIGSEFSHWLLRNADKILKYEAEAPLVATDVCDHYQIALGLRRIRNQKLWCTKNRQNSDCGLPNSTHLTE